YGFARASNTDRAAFHRLLEDYVASRERLAGVVWLLDIRRDPSDEDLQMGERFAERATPVLAVITKADKLTRTHRTRRVREILEAANIPYEQAIVTSATSGEGIDD